MAMAATALLVAGMAQARPADMRRRAAASVDSFIGTGGEGHTFPGATVLFGTTQQRCRRSEAMAASASYGPDDGTWNLAT